jgi:hypothetical protein
MQGIFPRYMMHSASLAMECSPAANMKQKHRLTFWLT